MKLICSFVLLACVWEASGYPAYYPYYGNNFDTLSYGSSDNNRGGMVMSRYFNPYYNPRTMGGMAAFMFKPSEEQTAQVQQTQSGQYYIPDRRRQTPPEEAYFPQQNEVFYPQASEKPVAETEPSELADPTEKLFIFPTTPRATAVPELTEPEVEEVEEPVQKSKKRVSKKKQVKKPVEDDEEEDDYQPKMPAGAFFPMFFGMGGRSSSGGMPGATAIANAYSTGRGGVATSHATAYGAPRPEFKSQP